MNKFIWGAAVVLFTAAIMMGCTGGSLPFSSHSSPNGTVPVSFSVKDNPPAGVTVLTFEVEITGASLLPSNSSSQPVPLISQPDDVELEHLQTDSQLLANLSVPAGTYNGITVSFANPEMTILNQTGSTLTLGSQSCGTQQVCEFSPTLNQVSVTVQAPTVPFPITLNANSPLVLRMDFNVNSSIQSNNFSITPTATFAELPALNRENEDEDQTELVGQITAINATNQSFTLQTGFMGMTSTIVTNSNTEFDFEDSCPADNFSCLQMGQIAKVEVQQGANGTLTATDVELFSPPSTFELRGTVTSINSTSNSFQIVIFDDEDFGQQMPNVSVGIPLAVNAAPQATFSVDTNGISLPSGLNFTSLSDMIIGQAVRVHPTSLVPGGTPPQITITTDKIELMRSEVTATIDTINASGTPPSFTLGTLPPLFTGASINSIHVDVLSTTRFESNDDMMTATGINNLAVGNVVSVGGLLFNTATTPTVVAEKIDLRQ